MTIPTLGCFGRGPGRRKNSAARRTAAAEAGQTQSEHVPREHEPRKPRQNAQTAADAAAKATRKTAAQALKQQQAQAAAAAAAALEPSSSAPTGASDSRVDQHLSQSCAGTGCHLYDSCRGYPLRITKIITPRSPSAMHSHANSLLMQGAQDTGIWLRDGWTAPSLQALQSREVPLLAMHSQFPEPQQASTQLLPYV